MTQSLVNPHKKTEPITKQVSDNHFRERIGTPTTSTEIQTCSQKASTLENHYNALTTNALSVNGPTGSLFESSSHPYKSSERVGFPHRETTEKRVE